MDPVPARRTKADGVTDHMRHDAHGGYRGQGNSTDHGSFINFDLSVVNRAATPKGSRLEYHDTGRFAGNCTLTRHGTTHIQFSYQAGRRFIRG